MIIEKMKNEMRDLYTNGGYNNMYKVFDVLDKYKKDIEDLEHKYKLALGNYNTALKVISDTDSSLKEYLESQEVI